MAKSLKHFHIAFLSAFLVLFALVASAKAQPVQVDNYSFGDVMGETASGSLLRNLTNTTNGDTGTAVIDPDTGNAFEYNVRTGEIGNLITSDRRLANLADDPVNTTNSGTLVINADNGSIAIGENGGTLETDNGSITIDNAGNGAISIGDGNGASLNIDGDGIGITASNDAADFRIYTDNENGGLVARDSNGNTFRYDSASRTIDFGDRITISTGNAVFRAQTENPFRRQTESPFVRQTSSPFQRQTESPFQRGNGATNRDCGGNTLGALICNTTASFANVPGLLTGFSYLCGIFLGFMGIMKLKDSVESPNQVPLWEPAKRFLAGGAFFALPYVYNAVRNTINGANGSVLTGSDYNTGGVSGEGLDAMLVGLMVDVWGPMQMILMGFAYLAGVILIMIGISRLLKSEQEGARGPMGFGTIMTFLVAGVLLSLNETLGAAVTSVFQSGVEANAVLGYTEGMSDPAIGHSNAVIGAIMAFVALLGWVSFIRGFFIMRGVAEGNSQASLMAGMTHILGGAVAVNLGGFIGAVQSTLGISENLGLTVSSIEPYITSVTFIA